jgi:hypothetical protein
MNQDARIARRMAWLNRRQLLQVGGVSALGLGLPQLLHGRAPVTGGGSSKTGIRSCIFIVQYGGASHIDSMDLKPDAPDKIRGPYRRSPRACPASRSANCGHASPSSRTATASFVR